MVCAAAAIALAGAPALGEGSADEGAMVFATICAQGGRRIVEIELGGGEPKEGSRHAPCHAACLVDRKESKRRGAR